MSSMIDDLLNPSSLPDKTVGVSLVQTHISSVIIADAFVYKIKKNVNFGFLDFSSLEKRHYYCQQEVKLNQRLSEDLYIGVLPVFFDGEQYTLGKGSGDIVDYAVKMRKIPENRIMKSVFERGGLREEHLQRIAQVLARFHQNARRSSEIDGYGMPEIFRVNTDENFKQTKEYIDQTIEKDDFNDLRQWTDHFYIQKGDIFQERIDKGKIRDCHGDLHMEHICLMEPLAVFDCIEFNERFRYSDTLADIAFLLMDLEFRGGKGFSEVLWDYYKALTGDEDAYELLRFYKVYRAYVRGKVNGFQLDDPHINHQEKQRAVEVARRYFKLARSYIDER